LRSFESQIWGVPALWKSERRIEPNAPAVRQMRRNSVKDDGVPNEFFQLEKPDGVHSALLQERKFGKAQTLYLLTTALATIGWLWLIAWCALQLV
jgi:hypothetical protein